MRCGKCVNCLKLESEKQLGLRQCQPYQLVNGRLVITPKPTLDNEAWNQTLALLPCTGHPKYQVKVRLATDDNVQWEYRPIWDETRGGLSFAEVRDLNLKHLSIFQPSAVEIRINEEGSLQGFYFDVPQLSKLRLPYLKVSQVKVGDILSDNGHLYWKCWEGSNKALTVKVKGGVNKEFLLTDAFGREYEATGQLLTSYSHNIIIRKTNDQWTPIGRFFCKYW